ncbi:MAG: Sapep family Mn(2+)-dependent dipeptidase [Oscillospiraceae bacterium]|nr:Sapep family Mn(2+)-dependent dipeptidase [Oscillospiraceae bacterium]
MDVQLRQDIDRFVAENETRIFEDIARLVAINSVEGEAKPGMPFGEGPARVLAEGLKLAEELGLEAVNCENYIGYAQIGEGEDYLATITHLDVVPVGEGWKEDPFTMREREGWIIGRGVMDDKGPSVLCLYALKYLKERNIPLRYPVRALLGANEETGMGDVEYYLTHYKAPLFCFSPDANFPLCNGEKGITRGRLIAKVPMENIVDIRGGFVSNAIPDKAEARIRAAHVEAAPGLSVEREEDGLWHLTAAGIGGHASLPEGTVNAIGVLVNAILDQNLAGGEEAKYLRAVADLCGHPDGSGVGVQADDGLFQPLTIVGSMIGVAEGRMVQTYDSRFPTNTSGAQIAAIIGERYAGVLEVEADRDAPPFYMSLDKPEVQVCIRAYNDITGENAEPYTIGGGTYARDFPNAVSFGPEHPERPAPDFAGPIHGVDEAASKDWLLEALKVYILALIELEKLAF